MFHFLTSLTAESDLLFCLSSPSTCALGTATYKKGYSAPKLSFVWQLTTLFDLAKTPCIAILKWTMRSWINAVWNRILVMLSSSTCTYTATSKVSKSKWSIGRIMSSFCDSINRNIEKESLMLSFMYLQMCSLPNFTHTQLHVLPN